MKVAAVGHGVPGVNGEVHQDLLQPGGVGFDGVDARFCVQVDRYGFGQGALEKLHDLFDERK